MSTKTVNLKDLAAELEAFSEKHLEELHVATVNGIARSIPHLVATSPVDTGLYAASWAFSQEEWGAVVGNFSPHAAIIEHGARPFTPPIKPLLEWAKRVLKDSSQPPNYSDQVWGLAKGTQNKIARVGMQPRKIMENAIPVIIENIRREYEQLAKH